MVVIPATTSLPITFAPLFRHILESIEQFFDSAINSALLPAVRQLFATSNQAITNCCRLG